MANITTKEKLNETIFEIVLNSLIFHDCIFGAFANRQYYNKISKRKNKKTDSKIPDFDILAEDPKLCSEILRDTLKENGFANVRVYKRAGVEIIAPHYELRVDGNTILFIYEPIACHSYTP